MAGYSSSKSSSALLAVAYSSLCPEHGAPSCYLSTATAAWALLQLISSCKTHSLLCYTGSCTAGWHLQAYQRICAVCGMWPLSRLQLHPVHSAAPLARPRKNKRTSCVNALAPACLAAAPPAAPADPAWCAACHRQYRAEGASFSASPASLDLHCKLYLRHVLHSWLTKLEQR